jgi:hypothetical protein
MMLALGVAETKCPPVVATELVTATAPVASKATISGPVL